MISTKTAPPTYAILTVGDTEGPMMEIVEGMTERITFQFSWIGILDLLLHHRLIKIDLSVLAPARTHSECECSTTQIEEPPNDE